MSLDWLSLRKDFLCNIDLPVFIKNVDGYYVYCNKAFLEFVGAPEHQIIGCRVHQLVSKKLAQEHEQVDQILLETASSQRYSISISPSNKIQKKVIFNKSLVFDVNQRISGIICSITDDVGSITTRAHVVRQLTSRELDVLGLLLVGKSVKAIALELDISAHTTSGYMKSIYLKLGAHSKNEALYKAIAIYGMKPVKAGWATEN